MPPAAAIPRLRLSANVRRPERAARDHLSVERCRRARGDPASRITPIAIGGPLRHRAATGSRRTNAASVALARSAIFIQVNHRINAGFPKVGRTARMTAASSATTGRDFRETRNASSEGRVPALNARSRAIPLAGPTISVLSDPIGGNRAGMRRGLSPASRMSAHLSAVIAAVIDPSSRGASNARTIVDFNHDRRAINRVGG